MSISFRLSSLLLLPALAFVPLSRADVLANYTFSNGNTLTSTDAHSQTTAGTFGAGPLGTNWAYSSAQNNYFARGNTTADSATAALAGSYFTFTLSLNALGTGNGLNLETLTFDTLSNNAAGATAGSEVTFFVRSSLDNFATNIGDSFNQSFNDGTAANPVARSVNLSAYQGVTATSIEFRIYVFDNTTEVNRTPRIDNVVLNGAVVPLSAIPEPSTAAALVAGFSLLAATALRRRKAK
ncbi:MAG: PEP-CTERM sorting domain-containing protein [Rariglobus sp.]